MNNSHGYGGQGGHFGPTPSPQPQMPTHLSPVPHGGGPAQYGHQGAPSLPAPPVVTIGPGGQQHGPAGQPQEGFIQHGPNWYFRNMKGNMAVMPIGWHPQPQHHILQGAHTAGWQWPGTGVHNIPAAPGVQNNAPAIAPSLAPPAASPVGGDQGGQSLYSALMGIINGY